MILSNVDIMRAVASGRIKFTPALKADQFGSGSVDLTLSNEFWRFKPEAKGQILELDAIDLDKIMEHVLASEITILPGELIHGKTVERITLPSNLCGHLEGRSRYARRGLAIHVTSAFVQPGSDNHQVLEITNLAPYAIKLRAGTRCTQVILEEVHTSTSKPYKSFGKIAKRQ